MPNVTVTYSSATAGTGYNFQPFYPDIAGADQISNASTTGFTVTNTAARGLGSPTTVKFRLSGTGFTYDGNGEPTAGTVGSLEILNSANTVLVTAIGFNFAVTALVAAIDAFNINSSNATGLNQIFISNIGYNATGNTGNDAFVGGALADSFVGGGGFNTVTYQNASAGVSASLSGSPTVPNSGDAAGDTYSNISALRGSGFNDTLEGNGSDNFLRGGGGADRLIGGGGFDTADYIGANTSNANVGVTVDLTTPSNNSGEASGDTYSSIENIRGSAFSDVLKGNGSNNILTGGTGADRFIASNGSDTVADFNRSSGSYDAGEGDKIELGNTSSIFTWTQLQSRMSGTTSTTIDLGSGNSLTINGVAPGQLTESDFFFAQAPNLIVTIQGAGRPIQGNGNFSAFWGFGDSNSDSGWFFNHAITTNPTRQALYDAAEAAGGGTPTTVGRPINSEYIASYFGLTAIPVGEAGGTNYAASGATITGNLPNSLAPNIVSQINSYLTSTGNVADPNAIYYFTGGGNSNKIAVDLDPVASIAYMVSEAHAMSAAIEALHDAGAQHILLENRSGGGVTGAAYLNTLWTDLAEADVPFLVGDSVALVNAITADPDAYGITNTLRPPVGPYNPGNPYDPNEGGSVINPNPSLITSSWALFGTQNQVGSEHWLYSDNEHLASAGHELQANMYRSVIDNGVPVVGQVLTANVSQFGANPTTVTLQWQRLVSGVWTDIAGATNETYTIQNPDLNTQLRVEASRTFDNGNQTVTRASAPTEAVTAVSTLAVDDHWYVSRGATAMLAPAVSVFANDAGPGVFTLDSVGGSINGTVSINGNGLIQFTATTDTTPLTAHFDYDMTSGPNSDTGHVEISLVTTADGSDTITVDTLEFETSFIQGKDGDDSITGGAGTDIFAGDLGTDTLSGGAGADILQGGGGDDALDGGVGVDTAVFSGQRAAYTITRNGGSTLVVGPDGTDTLISIESLQFDDQTMSLNGAKNDFNGDGRMDVLFSQEGAVYASNYEWQMNDRAIAGQGAIDLYDKAFSLQIVGDYDGDGKSDVIFQNPVTGGVWMWLLDGTAIKSQGAVDVADPTYHLLGSADFSGDGKSDLLFRNDAGFVYMWEMNGRSNTPLPVSALDPSWHVQGGGDFDGDGKADILLRNIGGSANEDGAFFLWKMDGAAVVAGGGGIERPSTAWKTFAVGDFDGDGKADFAVRNVSATGDNGAVWVYLMDGIAIKAQGAAGIADAATWHVQQIGDLNGDGKDDILFRNDLGYFYSWDMDGTSIASEGLAGTEAGNYADPAFKVVTQHFDLV